MNMMEHFFHPFAETTLIGFRDSYIFQVVTEGIMIREEANYEACVPPS